MGMKEEMEKLKKWNTKKIIQEKYDNLTGKPATLRQLHNLVKHYERKEK